MNRIKLHYWPGITKFKNKYFSIRANNSAVTGAPYTYMEFNEPGVRIVATDQQGRVLLVRQYRHPLGRYTWEVPAGGTETGEPCLYAAKRELHEETGLVASSWQAIGVAASLPNVTNFEAQVYLATDLTPGPARSNDDVNHETTEHAFFGPEEIRSLISNGETIDDKTLACLYLVNASHPSEL